MKLLWQILEKLKNDTINWPGLIVGSLSNHSNEVSRGIIEFIDCPPCLAALSKNKLSDGRDRFLYNYMVFAKKK